MDVNEVRRSVAQRIGDGAIATTPTEAQAISGIPHGWADVVGECDAEMRRRVAEQWRRGAPRLPRVADLLERELRHIWVAESAARYHYLKDFEFGNHRNAPDFGTTETVMIYIFDHYRHDDRCELWIGGPPYTGPIPDWWDTAVPVLGTFATDLHDGFMDYMGWCGILSVSNVHTVYDRLIRWTDPDMDEMNVFASDAPQAPELDRSEWPDFGQLVVLAEHQTWDAWAIDRTRVHAGWTGDNEYFHPTEDVAADIDELITIVLRPIEDTNESDAPDTPGVSLVDAPMTDFPRPPVFAATSVITAAYLTGAVGAVLRTAPSSVVRNLAAVPTPEGFARWSDGQERLRRIADMPWPTDLDVRAADADGSVPAISVADTAAIHVEVFRSTRTFVTVLGFEVPPGTGFGVGEAQHAMAFADPSGVRGFAVKSDIAQISGAQKALGVSMLISGPPADRTFAQHLVVAKVSDNIRLLVIVSPELTSETWVANVDQDLAVEVMRRAVAVLCEDVHCGQ
ncbi:hypothetical protein [Gordonia sp. (in: high G+C Gram-positive bacteria)]|uniref:hypothetical protein n=1 Tax=Gordonia sp. (in: high G+C Gram-positive bacteria) TaxID=84139 RepID=UPI00334208B4